MRGPGEEFFGPLTERMEAMLAQYTAEQITQFEAFLEHLETTMAGVLEEQARPGDSRGP